MNSIYFDEAGGTGSNLLDPEQPHFVYAGVMMEEPEAQGIIDSVRSNFLIQSPELKGRQIIRRGDGPAIAKQIIEACLGRTFLFAADKKAALSGKIFDYTVEPVLHQAGVKAQFFEMGVHRYFLNYFYMAWQLGPDAVQAAAGQLAQEFQAMSRSQDVSAAPTLFGGGPTGTGDGFLDDFIWFCSHHLSEIEAELDIVNSEETNKKWILELTNAALYSILTELDQALGPVRVVCDESHPINDYLPFLRDQIGEDDLLSHVQAIESASSFGSPGIQLADVVVSATASVLKNPTLPHADELLELVNPCMVWGIGFDESEIKPGPGTRGMMAYEVLMLSLKRGGSPRDALAMALYHDRHS